MAQNNAFRVDPRYSPYFRPQEAGDGVNTLGSGNGGGWMQGLFNLPGAEAYTTGGGQVSESSQDPGINPDALQAYLEQQGYQLNERPDGGNYERWISDAQGVDVGARESIGGNDDNFWTAALLAGALTGGAAAGFGSAGAGTLSSEAAGLGSATAGSGGGLGVGFGSAATTGGGVGGGFAGLGAGTYSGGLGLVEGLGALGAAGAAGYGGAAEGIPYDLTNADMALPDGFSGFQNVSGAEPGGLQFGTGGYEGSLGVGMGGGSTGGGVSGGFAGMGAGSYSGGLGLVGGMGALGGATSGGGSSSLGDFFSGNGSASDYGRLAQGALSLYGQNAASKAAQQGQSDSNALMGRMYDQNRADNQPLMDLRNATLPKIQGLINNPGSITSDPGYQFGLSQGQGQIDNQAAARGGYYSGQQLKASQKFGQDYAGTKLDDSLRRLQSVAGLGQVGATANQQNNQQYSQQGGNGLAQSGSIRGSGYIGMGRTAGNALGDWMNDFQSRRAWGEPG